MGLKERVARRFLRGLRRAGVKRDDVIVVPVDDRVQSYAALILLRELEEGYDTVLRAMVLGEVPECFSGALEGYEVRRLDFSPRSYSEFKEAVLGVSGEGEFVVLPFVAEDLAVALLSEVAVSVWRQFRLDVARRVSYPLGGTLLGEVEALYGGCGGAGFYGGESAVELLEGLRGRVVATALSKVYLRLAGGLRGVG